MKLRPAFLLLLPMLAVILLVVRYPLFGQEQGSSPLNLTDQEKEQFLLNAEVVKCTTNPVGFTKPLICTLSDGRLTHDAGFQTVNIRKPQFQTPSGLAAASFSSYFPVGSVVNEALCASGEITHSGLIPSSL